ncbi:hypothetical protein HKX48_003330 [Thoreauomyces humboldtii]|nr:hypothetical protein HKX48_003330 [Thoreauomyces humboldtii]
MWLNSSMGKGSSLHCVFPNGYAAELSPDLRAKVTVRPEVNHVEDDHLILLSQVPTTVGSVGIDRIDQTSLPLDNSYTPRGPAGQGVDVYVLDSGLLTTHSEFGGRASVGVSFSVNKTGTDVVGHGTHVAGTIGGRTVGVAPNVTIIAVKVIDDDGSGPASNVIMGLQWVVKAVAASGRPSVINMSIGGPKSTALDMATLAAVNAGITVVAAAGNDAHDACLDSPANLAKVITVAAASTADARATFSNSGRCVTLFAPGVGIRSSWNLGPNVYQVLDGTSMASPHTAGSAAIALSVDPTLTPAAVKSALLAAAVTGKLSGTLTGDPNTLLNVQSLFDGNVATTSNFFPSNPTVGMTAAASPAALAQTKTATSAGVPSFLPDTTLMNIGVAFLGLTTLLA